MGDGGSVRALCVCWQWSRARLVPIIVLNAHLTAPAAAAVGAGGSISHVVFLPLLDLHHCHRQMTFTVTFVIFQLYLFFLFLFFFQVSIQRGRYG